MLGLLTFGINTARESVSCGGNLPANMYVLKNNALCWFDTSFHFVVVLPSGPAAEVLGMILSKISLSMTEAHKETVECTIVIL